MLKFSDLFACDVTPLHDIALNILQKKYSMNTFLEPNILNDFSLDSFHQHCKNL